MESGLRESGKGIAQKRAGRQKDVASMICSLTSGGTLYVTGQSIVVDGGLTVRWPS
ncbi:MULTISPECIES: SDR family oxidoreductase [unclassified Burkholderia]|uniref:SDR family oxidoreductase n=1 Tax=unclassified Burkholderia TaxID=2613784 RepID=UPI0021AB5E82|nr:MULTISPECIES: SDR family oxidoreductase [unclassified Burkholderia]